MPNDGYYVPEVHARVQEDHFCASPVDQLRTAKALETLDALRAEIRNCQDALHHMTVTADGEPNG